MAALVTAERTGGGDEHEGWRGRSRGCGTHDLRLAQHCPTAQGAAPARKRDLEGEEQSQAQPTLHPGGRKGYTRAWGRGRGQSSMGPPCWAPRPAPAPSGELRAASFRG